VADYRRVEPEAQAGPEAAEPDRAPGQIACSMVSCLLRQVRTAMGGAAVEEVIRTAGVPYSADHLDDVANWIWYEEAIALPRRCCSGARPSRPAEPQAG
jgi:hypothetical protein